MTLFFQYILISFDYILQYVNVVTVIFNIQAKNLVRPDKRQHYYNYSVNGQNILNSVLSLQSLEVFSCEISNIEATSLSILDPTSLQLDIFQKVDEPIKLDLMLNQIRMRLSYNDCLLLQSIGENLKRSMKNMNKPAAEPNVDIIYKFDQNGESGQTGQPGGPDATTSQHRTLFWRAYPLSTMSQEDIIPHLPKLVKLPPSLLTLSAERISLTLIDDSGERDIPLIEVESKDLITEATELSVRV